MLIIDNCPGYTGLDKTADALTECSITNSGSEGCLVWRTDRKTTSHAVGLWLERRYKGLGDCTRKWYDMRIHAEVARNTTDHPIAAKNTLANKATAFEYCD
jgi:hypothetical protein